jgi:hypothetical protein
MGGGGDPWTNAMRSSSQWNQLLTLARKRRGPFWDPNTELLQVPKYTKWYYRGVSLADLPHWERESFYSDTPPASAVSEFHTHTEVTTSSATTKTRKPISLESPKDSSQGPPSHLPTTPLSSTKEGLRITIKLPTSTSSERISHHENEGKEERHESELKPSSIVSRTSSSLLVLPEAKDPPSSSHYPTDLDIAKCHRCGSREGSLLSCANCSHLFHSTCLSLPVAVVHRIQSYALEPGWLCPDCKTCNICEKKLGTDRILSCSSCDRQYHDACVTTPLSGVASHEIMKKEDCWKCPACVQLPSPHIEP